MEGEMAWELYGSLLLSGCDRLICQACDINRRTFNAQSPGLELRHFQQAIDTVFKTIAGSRNRDQEFMAFLTRNAALMAQQRSSIALDGGERAAQLVTNCCQQFRLEQPHLLKRSVFQSRFQIVDTSSQQDIHEHGSD